jgi:integrase
LILPLRIHEYLTDAEVASLTDAAKGNPYGHRDATMILTAYRHGFRVSELVDLRWDQIDFASTTLHVRRAKRREAPDARISPKVIFSWRFIARSCQDSFPV